MDFEALLAGSRAFAENAINLLLPPLAVLIGLWVIYSAIRKLAEKGNPRQSMGGRDATWGGIGMQLLIGGLLLRFGATVEDISLLITGAEIQGYQGVMAYAPMPQGGGAWQQVIEVCLLWVVMIGWAGAFRGLMLWNKAADGGGGGGNGGDLFWQGTWHLIGGALAVNMTGAIRAFFG